MGRDVSHRAYMVDVIVSEDTHDHCNTYKGKTHFGAGLHFRGSILFKPTEVNEDL